MSLDYQSKEEVEEYLQNLGIEYRFQCYSEKRPDGKRKKFVLFVIYWLHLFSVLIYTA